MTKQVILAAVALAVAMPGWAEAKKRGASPKEERVGVGSGFVVGAAAGGPVGMIIGAAIGGIVGNKMHEERAAREDFERRFAEASENVEMLQSLLNGSERDVAELRALLNDQTSNFRDALRETLAAEVYFHTGESVIDGRSRERLARIGDIVRLIDDFSIVVEGHADSRGDSVYNEQLSAERAEAVRSVLVATGIPADRVTALAAGEAHATAAEDDFDSLALERRVRLNVVYPDVGGRVARQ